MAVATLQNLLRGMFRAHETASPDQGLKPAIVAADWTQWSKEYVNARTTADAAAATVSEQCLFTIPWVSGVTITAVYILPDGAVTANGSTFATLQLGTRPQAGGGSQTTLGTALTTASVSWVANSQLTYTLPSGGVTLAQNLVLTLAITKASTGVQLPATTITIEFIPL